MPNLLHRKADPNGPAVSATQAPLCLAIQAPPGLSASLTPPPLVLSDKEARSHNVRYVDTHGIHSPGVISPKGVSGQTAPLPRVVVTLHCHKCGGEFTRAVTRPGRIAYVTCPDCKHRTQREAVRRYQNRDPRRRPANNAVHAVGQESCAICQSTGDTIAHHADYNRPHLICFLCRACHKKYHEGCHEVEPAPSTGRGKRPRCLRPATAAELVSMRREFGLGIQPAAAALRLVRTNLWRWETGITPAALSAEDVRALYAAQAAAKVRGWLANDSRPAGGERANAPCRPRTAAGG